VQHSTSACFSGTSSGLRILCAVDRGFLRYWRRHSYDRQELISLIASMPRYIACPKVTKRTIFNFISSGIRPDHTVFIFAFPDDYSFGILQSRVHWLWFTTTCSRLKSDFRYTPPTVYSTFPYPQSSMVTQIDAIADAGRNVRRIRSAAMLKTKGGLRALYRIDLQATESLTHRGSSKRSRGIDTSYSGTPHRPAAKGREGTHRNGRSARGRNCAFLRVAARSAPTRARGPGDG